MKYLCLVRFDERILDAMPEPQLDAFVQECEAYDRELERSGHLRVAHELRPI